MKVLFKYFKSAHDKPELLSKCCSLQNIITKHSYNLKAKDLFFHEMSYFERVKYRENQHLRKTQIGLQLLRSL